MLRHGSSGSVCVSAIAATRRPIAVFSRRACPPRPAPRRGHRRRQQPLTGLRLLPPGVPVRANVVELAAQQFGHLAQSGDLRLMRRRFRARPLRHVPSSRAREAPREEARWPTCTLASSPLT
jgi:hypothetical protein